MYTIYERVLCAQEVHICAQHVCFKRARFQVSYRFIRVITCYLRGSPYRRSLGVIIFDGSCSLKNSVGLFSWQLTLLLMT